MVTEVPVQLLGQNVFNLTSSGTPTSGAVIIQSGTNTRGVIIRTAIIVSNGAVPPPPPSSPPALFADFGVGPFVPFPPPAPAPTTRYILVAGGFTGISQLNWPVYLEPTLGLAFAASGTFTGYDLHLTWDHGTLDG